MRKYYLDNIRWSTLVIVVIYHVFYMYNAEGIVGGIGRITDLPVQYYDVFMYLVYPWIMPVLFLVSGIVSRIYLKSHTDREFIRARTRKLLVPSTIGLFVFQFVQGYVNISISGAFKDMAGMGIPKPVIGLVMIVSGSGVLWFMQLLWVYCMLLILIRKIEKGRLLELGSRTPVWMIILFFFPVWGGAQILNTPIVVVYRIGFYFLFFFLGYYVFSNDEVMDKLTSLAVPAIAAGLVLSLVFSAVYFFIKGQMNYADVPVNRGPLFSASAYFGSLAMLAGMARFGNRTGRFASWMSERSFGLYVFHYLGISSVALYIGRPHLLPAPACYILSLIAGFVFGFGLYYIISRIPFFRWAVLGIKKEKKTDVQ